MALLRSLTATLIKPRNNSILQLTRNMSAASSYTYENIKVTEPKEFVFNIEFNRPEKRNAFTLNMYREIGECVEKLGSDENCRVVIISGSGKLFSAGIDVMDLATGILSFDGDIARKGFHIRRSLEQLQKWHTNIEKCPKPVLAAMHNACVGGGVDLVTACDMRYCTQDFYMQVKEVDIGLAADLGTLQRLPKVMGNDSLVRELCYTARKMFADESLKQGFVSRVFPDKDSMMSGVLDIAVDIASKSPVAVQGTKVNLLYSRDHSVQSGLDHMAAWNIGMLQSEDTTQAAQGAMTKQPVKFSKL